MSAAIGIGLLAYRCNRLCRCGQAMCCNGCDNCKTNNTAVKMTTVQRISKFRKDTWCVKGGWCSFKILHSIKFQFFAHTVQKCSRDCFLSYRSNVLPHGYSMSVHTFVRHAGSPQLEFCEKCPFFATLEKSTTGRGVKMRYL